MLDGTLRVVIYGDGKATTYPLNHRVTLRPAENLYLALPDLVNSVNQWRLEMTLQRPDDPLTAMVRERLGDRWVPLVLRLQLNGTMLGPPTPAMLYAGVTDCPSVTWIPGHDFGPGAPRTFAWAVSMTMVG